MNQLKFTLRLLSSSYKLYISLYPSAWSMMVKPNKTHKG